MTALRKRYARLHLKVNDAKSAVARAFGRKFLGYCLWAAPGGEVKRAVAAKAKAAFKQRVRWLTKRNRGRSMERVKDAFSYGKPSRTETGPAWW
jgi:RNA-directed DNA polymerase